MGKGSKGGKWGNNWCPFRKSWPCFSTLLDDCRRHERRFMNSSPSVIENEKGKTEDVVLPSLKKIEKSNDS